VSKPVRLDRLLANCGIGSRTEVDGFIRRGTVNIGARTVRDPATKVAPEQFGEVLVHGEPLDRPWGLSVVLHKPVGYACSHDRSEAPTVDELLPASWARRTPRPEWAGRLDRATSGLLLITDDHQLIHRLTSPKHHVKKLYEVTLAEPLAHAAAAIDHFAAGVHLHGEERPCVSAELRTTSDPVRVDVVLSEGRYHQVRRMFAAVGGEVVALHRTRFGPWELGDLKSGELRDLPPA
jgi:16S rRNA pseudouridine516 synthase